MATYEIPLSPMPQAFSIQLAQVEYRLTFTFRDADEAGWVMDIADTEGAVILAGVPLVTGADLLEQYKHLGLGGSLYVATDGAPDETPTYETLGGPSRLFWVTP